MIIGETVIITELIQNESCCSPLYTISIISIEQITCLSPTTGLGALIFVNVFSRYMFYRALNFLPFNPYLLVCNKTKIIAAACFSVLILTFLNTE